MPTDAATHAATPTPATTPRPPGTTEPATGRKFLLAIFLACTPCSISGVAAILTGLGVALSRRGVVGLSGAALLGVAGILWLRRRRACPA